MLTGGPSGSRGCGATVSDRTPPTRGAPSLGLAFSAAFGLDLLRRNMVGAGPFMSAATRVVYVGPEAVFHGLEGRLVTTEDRDTGALKLLFQPECTGIMALPCEADHVRAIEPSAALNG